MSYSVPNFAGHIVDQVRSQLPPYIGLKVKGDSDADYREPRADDLGLLVQHNGPESQPGASVEPGGWVGVVIAGDDNRSSLVEDEVGSEMVGGAEFEAIEPPDPWDDP